MKRALLILAALAAASSQAFAVSATQTIHWNGGSIGAGSWDKTAVHLTATATVSGCVANGNYIVTNQYLGPSFTIAVANCVVTGVTGQTTHDAQAGGAYAGQSATWTFTGGSGFSGSITLGGDTSITVTRQDSTSGYIGPNGTVTSYTNSSIAFVINGNLTPTPAPTPTPSATPTPSGTPSPPPTPTPSGTPPLRCAWQLTGVMRSQCLTGTINSHTIALYKNGLLVGQQVIPPGYTGGDLDFNGDDDNGTTIQLKVDDVTGAEHTVICYGDPPPGNWWHADILLPGSCNATPTPRPSATPGATPRPTLTPSASPPHFTPPPGGSPGPTQGPPPGGTPTTVAVQNMNDFYEPVRKAVRDSGNDTIVNAQNKAPMPGVELDDSKMNEITDAVNESKNLATQIADGVTEATDTASEKVAALSPGGIGSECLITINTTGFIHDKLKIDNFNINLCTFSVGIGIFRACVLWGMVCMFFVLTLRTLIYDS